MTSHNSCWLRHFTVTSCEINAPMLRILFAKKSNYKNSALSVTPTVTAHRHCTIRCTLTVTAHGHCTNHCTPTVTAHLHCTNHCTPTITTHRHCTIRCTADHITNTLPLLQKLGHFTCFKYIIEPAVLKMYCRSATVSFCKPALTLWELCTILADEMYKNMYCVLVLAQLLMGRNLLRNVA